MRYVLKEESVEMDPRTEVGLIARAAGPAYARTRFALAAASGIQAVAGTVFRRSVASVNSRVECTP